MSVDYGDVIDYPIRGDDAVKRFAVGAGIPVVVAIVGVIVAILSILLPFLGLLNLLLYPVGFAITILWTGYYVRVARSTYAGESEPPGFENPAGLLKDGVFGFVIGLVYSIPLVVMFVGSLVLLVVVVGGVGSLGGNSGSAAATAGTIGLLVFLVVGFLSFLYGILMFYLLPISICSYAADDSLSAAFSVGRIKGVALQADYAIPWLLVTGVNFAAQMFVGLLSAILIGYLLQPLLPVLYFYTGIAAYYAFGQVYDGTVGTSRAEPEVPASDSFR